MIAGTRNITIYRGCAYAETLDFVRSSDITVPIDLSGITPFTAQVRDNSRKPVLLTLSVENVDLVNGRIAISATAEQTAALNPHTSKWGIRDFEGVLWVQGLADILPAIPE